MANDRTVRGIRQAAELIGRADALLVTAGAGIGVDSGLPDFRGRDGFWRAYPALKERGLSFEQMAQPQWFSEDPETAWAFYGHRQQLYRETKPHPGFGMLLEWGRVMPGEYFVVTSNVDGQFQVAGFAAERVVELHGSLDVYQCTKPCRPSTWRDSGLALDIDLELMRVQGEVPRCPHCGAVARPNVLMFGDPDWVPDVTREQERRYRDWLSSVRGRRLVVLELGAGTAIPTIRRLGEDLVAEGAASLVRINPDATDADESVIPIRMGALEALRGIEEKLPEAFRQRRPAVVPAGPREVAPITEKIHLHLGALTRVDLGRGLVGLADQSSADDVEAESACVKCYMDAQQAWVPMPELKGMSAPGYTMTARIFRTPEYDDGGTPGIAIVFIQDRHGNPVLTLGLARRASDSPFLWELLYNTATRTLAPLDFPKLPWLALRPDTDLTTHAVAMPYLEEFGRTLAWGWLKLAAFIDATKPKRGGT